MIIFAFKFKLCVIRSKNSHFYKIKVTIEQFYIVNNRNLSNIQYQKVVLILKSVHNTIICVYIQ